MTEITDEQKEAWLRVLGRWIDQAFDNDLSVIAPLLPPELTNPQPALPTEPGGYQDSNGVLAILDPRGEWHDIYGDPINPMAYQNPFTLLVPERPQITQAQIESVIRAWVGSPGGAASAVFDLVSGNDQ